MGYSWGVTIDPRPSLNGMRHPIVTTPPASAATDPATHAVDPLTDRPDTHDGANGPTTRREPGNRIRGRFRVCHEL